MPWTFHNDNEDITYEILDRGITNGVTPSSAISGITRTMHTFISTGRMFLCYNYLYRQIHFICNNIVRIFMKNMNQLRFYDMKTRKAFTCQWGYFSYNYNFHIKIEYFYFNSIFILSLLKIAYTVKIILTSNFNES